MVVFIARRTSSAQEHARARQVHERGAVVLAVHGGRDDAVNELR